MSQVLFPTARKWIKHKGQIQGTAPADTPCVPPSHARQSCQSMLHKCSALSLSTIPQYPRPFIFPGRIYSLDLGIVLLLFPGPSLMPRNTLEQHLPAGCCFSTLGWGCALCLGSTSPLTSWKDSTFLWKNFTPLCISLGSTNSFVTGKLKANVQYQDTCSALEITGIKSSLKFIQSQKHLDAAASIPLLSLLSCNKCTPGLTVIVTPLRQ